jgi:S-DNA-T family DNA segregation ATPase FtsK/SpoIIIE
MSNVQVVNSDYDKNFGKIYKFIDDLYQKYVQNNYDNSIYANDKKTTIIISGIDSFKNRLNTENKSLFGSMFEKIKDLGNINIIISDSIDKIKKYENESWYKSTVTAGNGIWVGNGISEQFTIKLTKITKELREDIPDNFCYVVLHGKVRLTQYVESFITGGEER